nr:orexigenic neuropeptide QRFP [Equus asinus]
MHGPRVSSNFSLFPLDQMIGPYSLSYLLLLPLGTCFPRLDREGPVDARGGIGRKMSWADLAGGPQVHSLWGSSPWPRAPQSPALLVTAKELQAAGRERAGFRFRFGRQDDGSEATGFLPADGEKESGPLGTLAEELNGYSRKKGGFSFRFGRGRR